MLRCRMPIKIVENHLYRRVSLYCTIKPFSRINRNSIDNIAIMQDKETISAGDSLVVRSYDDKCSYILDVNGEKKINKSRVSLKEIIGQPYGAVFELNNRKFQRVS